MHRVAGLWDLELSGSTQLGIACDLVLKKTHQSGGGWVSGVTSFCFSGVL